MGMDPVSWAIIAASVSAIGAGASAYSQYETGKATQRLNEYNAQIADQNAQVAARDANIQANQIRDRNRRIEASQRAAFAASGVVGETGSPLMVQVKQAAYLEMGALETERQGNIEAGKQRQQAVIDRMSGKIAAQSGAMNAGATLLQGAGNAAGAYAKIKGF
jgi:hypothetical protein